jgi:hypothetical protein
MRSHRIRLSLVVPISGLVLAAAACGSSTFSSQSQARDAGSSPSTTELPATSESTIFGTVGQSTDTTIIDPKNYHPVYDSIASLAYSSTAVFVGTVQPFFQDPSAGGKIAPFKVDQLLLGVIPRSDSEPELPQEGPGALPVSVGQEYLVFWRVDSSNAPTTITSCAVGGARGLYTYDPNAQTATRTLPSTSTIPATLTLSQVIAALPDANVPVPTPVPSPPVCSPSVTNG